MAAARPPLSSWEVVTWPMYAGRYRCIVDVDEIVRTSCVRCFAVALPAKSYASSTSSCRLTSVSSFSQNGCMPTD